MKKLIIATRESLLALTQARFVQQRLAARGVESTLLGMTTEGDRQQSVTLSQVGGKGLFVKELEQALLSCRADIAVHSLKDVPMVLPDGLCLSTILRRESAWDVLVSREPLSLDSLPAGLRVGTSSLRRQAQLLARYPHIHVQCIRGNVDTRLKKLANGEYDAIVLARAGLQRLHLTPEYMIELAPPYCLPAAGQGALGIECRSDDLATREAIAFLHDEETAKAVVAERACVTALEGDCKTPIAAYAHVNEDAVTLQGWVAMPDGSHVLMHTHTHPQAEIAGRVVADALLAQGAKTIIARTRCLHDYTVVVTRPKPLGNVLQQRLSQIGLSTMYVPALAIQPLPLPTLHVPSLDWLIYHSRYAVKYGHALRVAYPRARVAAIGPGTRAACEEHGLLCEVTPTEPPYTSEALLPLLGDVKGKTVVLVKGVEGRAWLAEQLMALGASVHLMNVYERMPPVVPAEKIRQCARLSTKKVILITSAESLLSLVQVFDEDWSLFVNNAHAIVISETLKMLVLQQGFFSVSLSTSAQDDDVINAVKEYVWKSL